MFIKERKVKVLFHILHNSCVPVLLTCLAVGEDQIHILDNDLPVWHLQREAEFVHLLLQPHLQVILDDSRHALAHEHQDTRSAGREERNKFLHNGPQVPHVDGPAVHFLIGLQLVGGQLRISLQDNIHPLLGEPLHHYRLQKFGGIINIHILFGHGRVIDDKTTVRIWGEGRLVLGNKLFAKELEQMAIVHTLVGPGRREHATKVEKVVPLILANVTLNIRRSPEALRLTLLQPAYVRAQVETLTNYSHVLVKRLVILVN
mmetsp:Transcript_25810/g.72278  ORF Transcript_25810/g.72278 Transcript_25810/m.72278 type:complete len:260 (-) Transcript_25810:262-1041(-)